MLSKLINKIKRSLKYQEYCPVCVCMSVLMGQLCFRPSILRTTMETSLWALLCFKNIFIYLTIPTLMTWLI